MGNGLLNKEGVGCVVMVEGEGDNTSDSVADGEGDGKIGGEGVGEGDSRNNGDGEGVGEGTTATRKKNNRHYNILFISALHVMLLHVEAKLR